MPTDLRTTSDNPVFGNDASTKYRDEYYRQAINPQVDAERIRQASTGNADSTYGATAVAGLQAQGANQAFFAGEDYRNQLINQTLARRDSLFGNEGRIAQEQNQLDIQRGLGVEDVNTARYGMLNNFQLGSAGILGNMYDTKVKADAEAERAKAAAKASLLGGLFGLGGGVVNSFMGGGRSSGGGSSSLNSGQNATGAFGSMSPFFTPINYGGGSGFKF